jgi:hypothetical protein
MVNKVLFATTLEGRTRVVFFDDFVCEFYGPDPAGAETTEFYNPILHSLDKRTYERFLKDHFGAATRDASSAPELPAEKI